MRGCGLQLNSFDDWPVALQMAFYSYNMVHIDLSLFQPDGI